ncbi:MAG: porin family protein [Bacteroidota bacterium]
MKKIFQLSALFALLLAPNVHGTPANDGATDHRLADKVKFGVHLKGFGSTWGVFGEYKFHEAVGIQTAVLKFSDFYLMKGTDDTPDEQELVKPNYVSFPLLLRLYPSKSRRFCLYAGFQFNYLRGVRIIEAHTVDNNFASIANPLKNIEEKTTKLKGADGIKEWTTHLVYGFDHEWDTGIQLGLVVGKGLNTLKKCDKTAFNFITKFTLGYNVAKLF